MVSLIIIVYAALVLAPTLYGIWASFFGKEDPKFSGDKFIYRS